MQQKRGAEDMQAETLISAVVIGRNEGARLVRCLDVLAEQNVPVAYVDSGSTDGSVAEARARGAIVAELDLSRPFTAARARNAGFEALEAHGVETRYIQFVDGDCALVSGWLDAGVQALSTDSTLGIVTGWRAEIHRNRSVYNALCDFEWHRPAGDILTCGGDMMVRRSAWEQVGGFNPNVIAAEDDEFCVRIRAAGWKIKRLPCPMTQHDAAMTRFSQWWQRAIRSGHGFAQVGALHPQYFRRERQRVWVYGLILPLLALAGLGISWLLLVFVIGLYALSYWRTIKGLISAGLTRHEAWHHAVYLSLSKVPNMIGMAVYYWRRTFDRDMSIIEYK